MIRAEIDRMLQQEENAVPTMKIDDRCGGCVAVVEQDILSDNPTLACGLDITVDDCPGPMDWEKFNDYMENE